MPGLAFVTEAAARSAFRYFGTGDARACDAAAVDAMRTHLNSLPFGAVIVTGEGEKDDAPMLKNNECVGVSSDISSDNLCRCGKYHPYHQTHTNTVFRPNLIAEEDYV
jgi:fructose-1,6-bisphosphatase/sedoheptulose 1,7-bisphosphatase-like protein